MKKLRFYILAIITVFTLSCFASINKVYADSPQDISFTLNASDYSARVICDDSDSSLPNCTGYTYFFVEFSDIDRSTSYFTVYTNSAQTESFRVYDYGVSYVSYSLPSNLSYLRYTAGIIHNYFSTFPNGTINVTVSASNNCPTCPTCPEPLDPNRSSIMQDFHDIFMNTMISVISICPIVFIIWFFIDMLSSLVFGRGK